MEELYTNKKGEGYWQIMKIAQPQIHIRLPTCQIWLVRQFGNSQFSFVDFLLFTEIFALPQPLSDYGPGARF